MSQSLRLWLIKQLLTCRNTLWTNNVWTVLCRTLRSENTFVKKRQKMSSGLVTQSWPEPHKRKRAAVRQKQKSVRNTRLYLYAATEEADIINNTHTKHARPQSRHKAWDCTAAQSWIHWCALQVKYLLHRSMRWNTVQAFQNSTDLQ